MGRISMPQGRGSQLHNRRDYEKIGRSIPDNIDPNKTSENVIFCDKEIHAAYQEIFGEAVDQYNAKQKRADRKIKDYYSHIVHSKNGEKPFYEDVLQWGSKEDFGEHPEYRQVMKDIYKEYVTTFEQRNPNLKLIGAYLHMDEASPHLHLDYIPVADGYKNGMKIRNSLDRAMKQMSFRPTNENRKNNATKMWKENERLYFAELCRSKGLTVEKERKARGSLSVEEYKEAKHNMMGDLQEEYNNLWEEYNQLSSKVDEIKSMDEVVFFTKSNIDFDKTFESVKIEDYTIPAQKTFFGQIKTPERNGVFVQGMNQNSLIALIKRIHFDNYLKDEINKFASTKDTMMNSMNKRAAEIEAKANELLQREEKAQQQETEISAKTKRLNYINGKIKEANEDFDNAITLKNIYENDVTKLQSVLNNIIEDQKSNAKYVPESIWNIMKNIVRQFFREHPEKNVPAELNDYIWTRDTIEKGYHQSTSRPSYRGPRM